MFSKKILIVDDDRPLLKIYAAALPDHEVYTADSAEEALKLIAIHGPFAVVVSDQNMPGMYGVEFLARLRKVQPDTVRVMLTSVEDQRTAASAVNKAEIFRFVAKPPSRPELQKLVNDGIRQHQLLRTERDLLENTLRGSIAALCHVLSLSEPRVFRTIERNQSLIVELASQLGVREEWTLEASAMLSQVGYVILPVELIDKVFDGSEITPQEAEMYSRFAAASAELIEKIPRLESVADIVRYQLRGFDGSGTPTDGPIGDDLPLGSRLLRVLHDFSLFELHESSREAALARMESHARAYDPAVLRALKTYFAELDGQSGTPITEIPIAQLRVGMTIARDIRLRKDLVLVCRRQVVTKILLDRLNNLVRAGAIDDMVYVTADN